MRGTNVIDATFTCTDKLGSGGQAKCWYATDNQKRGVAVKVFKNYPAGAAFNDEVTVYKFLGLVTQDNAHPNLIRMLHHNPDGLQVFDKLNYQRACAYIVLEDIPGGDFLEYCSRV